MAISPIYETDWTHASPCSLSAGAMNKLCADICKCCYWKWRMFFWELNTLHILVNQMEGDILMILIKIPQFCTLERTYLKIHTIEVKRETRFQVRLNENQFSPCFICTPCDFHYVFLWKHVQTLAPQNQLKFTCKKSPGCNVGEDSWCSSSPL